MNGINVCKLFMAALFVVQFAALACADEQEDLAKITEWGIGSNKVVGKVKLD